MDNFVLLCRNIYENNKITQRELANIMGISLGKCNQLIKEALEKDLISYDSETGVYSLTKGGVRFLSDYRVDSAVILAAGFGSRFMPLTSETPKGLLEVFGERMIERQIRQLNAAGISDITIMVGYLNEKFEYLIDKYGVKLIYNPEYKTKNTLATLWRARECFIGKNTYLCASDNWMRNNMFHTYECNSWYSSVYMEGPTPEWCLSYNKKGQITGITIGGEDSWVMYGPAYFSKEFSEDFFPVLETYYNHPGTEDMHWELVLMELINGTTYEHSTRRYGFPKPLIYINKQPRNQVAEFESVEELQRFDEHFRSRSQDLAIKAAASILGVDESDIVDFRPTEAGMTNRSFLFSANDNDYICRIPGTGTEELIDRAYEKTVYDAIAPLDLSEKIIFMDAKNGFKISAYYEGSRNADPKNWDEVTQCMHLIAKVHESGIVFERDFNFSERITYYESLCNGYEKELFEDYDTVRGHITTLLARLEKLGREKRPCHIDCVCDNFLFVDDGTLRLIDWEYAGMCDPICDPAMWAIYSYYNEEEVNRLLQTYLGREATVEERFAYYSYIVLGGFVWCLWAVYKSSKGQDLGEYGLREYRYAKTYYKTITTAPEFLDIGV